MSGPCTIKASFRDSSYAVTVTDGKFEDIDFVSGRIKLTHLGSLQTDPPLAGLF